MNINYTLGLNQKGCKNTALVVLEWCEAVQSFLLHALHVKQISKEILSYRLWQGRGRRENVIILKTYATPPLFCWKKILQNDEKNYLTASSTRL